MLKILVSYMYVVLFRSVDFISLQFFDFLCTLFVSCSLWRRAATLGAFKFSLAQSSRAAQQSETHLMRLHRVIQLHFVELQAQLVSCLQYFLIFQRVYAGKISFICSWASKMNTSHESKSREEREQDEKRSVTNAAKYIHHLLIKYAWAEAITEFMKTKWCSRAHLAVCSDYTPWMLRVRGRRKNCVRFMRMKERGWQRWMLKALNFSGIGEICELWALYALLSVIWLSSLLCSPLQPFCLLLYRPPAAAKRLKWITWVGVMIFSESLRS